MNNPRLAANLRYLRLKGAFTQETIAELLACDKSLLSFYESGKRTPSLGKLRRLASIYQTTIDALVNDDMASVFTEEESE